MFDPSNRPAAKVPVGIARQRDTYAQTFTDANGVARICDAPIDPVDVFIGHDACGLVVIKGVKPLWIETKKLFVTYASSTCGDFTTFPKNCHTILRIKDQSGHPIAGAHIGDKEPTLSDSLGRIFRTIEEQQTLEGNVTKSGYLPTPISQKCSLRELDADRELVVVLRKR
ncbi:MAG TPA: hypothetical protein VLM42_12335 [Bryobacteraceae bacterium]|nr:hypothetical protein [Bryobacteraceae bacterium]